MNDKIHSRHQTLERQILNWIIVDGKWPIGLSVEYFQGKEYELAIQFKKQWDEKTIIDSNALPDSFNVIIAECLELHGTGSKVAIENLKKVWAWRELAKTVNSAFFEEDVSKAIEIIQDCVFNVSMGGAVEDYDHSATIEHLINAIREGCKKKKGLLGYSSGLDSLDETMNGFEKGKFYVIGALKKTGKSRFMAYLGIRFSEQGASVLFESLEMNAVQLNSLAISFYSNINSRYLGREIPKHEQKNIVSAIPPVHALRWKIYSDMNIEDIKSRIYYEKPDVLFVDFIQKVRSDAYAGKRAQEMERVAHELADIAHHNNVCVIALTQLSGYVEQHDKEEIPNISHMKESQGIAESLDCGIIMHNPKRHESPFTPDGSYVYQEFGMRIEQRYDISGGIVTIKGDMRNCQFEDLPKI